MWRLSLWFLAICTWFFLIGMRLFYWQIFSAGDLSEAASNQHFFKLILPAQRGTILSSDGSSLVTNQSAYLVYVEPQKVTNKNALIKTVAETLSLEPSTIDERLSQEGIVWTVLGRKIDEEKVKTLKSASIAGLGFEREAKRFYPEASMAAQLLGFVAADTNGQDKGYFGVEGFYNRELKGRDGFLVREKDARGFPILLSEEKRVDPEDGRNITLFLDKTIQKYIEDGLALGIEKYGAKAGYVIALDPKTGGILGMAGSPSFDPGAIEEYTHDSYLNPSISSTYEPGSTFKTLVMGLGFDKGVITPKTTFNEDGPVQIGEYTIRTWNNEYHGKMTMREVLQHSSNVGMVFVQNKLGTDDFIWSIKSFGFGRATGIDLEGEVTPGMRNDNEWIPIDLATASFGQGIAVTPIQMVTAVGALANEGKLMEPHVVKKVIDANGRIIEVKPKIIRKVISPQAAHDISEMMVFAVDNGEAKWAKPKGYRIAGKTGTAQIPVAGHYDAEKTIASFVGFAPADDPKFVMLVVLKEPTSSPWGSETAAPLFFDIARGFFTYYGIAP